jgi:hypothetical protein
VWHRNNEIFLNQGKYKVEILNKFGMLNRKPMATPMVMNMKKLSMSSSHFDEIDPSIYRNLIRSFMYLVNTTPYIFYAASPLSHFISQIRQTYCISVKHVFKYL